MIKYVCSLFIPFFLWILFQFLKSVESQTRTLRLSPLKVVFERWQIGYSHETEYTTKMPVLKRFCTTRTKECSEPLLLLSIQASSAKPLYRPPLSCSFPYNSSMDYIGQEAKAILTLLAFDCKCNIMFLGYASSADSNQVLFSFISLYFTNKSLYATKFSLPHVSCSKQYLNWNRFFIHSNK